MRSNGVRSALLVVTLGVLVVGLGFDIDRPLVSARIRELEMQLEGVQDDLDNARWELRDLTVRLEEADETLELEQQLIERLKAELADCEGGAGGR